ncbi:MLO-like protein 4 isoform X3 [Mercurialis annua]|uniref:MLO-like protein 4 isoform X3 n=1 Tax=Mercurialis annua TaxID=3986 RepID=UPI00215E1B6E|nr:MLO-like protein 4 isoform X3 [Mercurialis annua]
MIMTMLHYPIHVPLMISLQEASTETDGILTDMGEGMIDEDKSLALTPTWAPATVITFMVILGFFFQVALKRCWKWLDKTKRKPLLSALDKIKDELMVFGVLSLLMGHWVVVVAKICVKTSTVSSRFFPCAVNDVMRFKQSIHDMSSSNANHSNPKDETYTLVDSHHNCPKGHESFASQESLEQLHRLMFVLGVVHVLYSFIVVALAMIKIYSWKFWEKQAKTMAAESESTQGSLGSSSFVFHNRRMTRLNTFISHRTSHPWSQNKALVWLLCFSRQFWSSINYSDYMALRYGFITTHELPLTYDFHNYILRSMEEEFRDVVGISLPLWVYAICCIFLDFHETYIYFWLSFLPAILILLIGTKLHRVVVKLAVEITDPVPRTGNHPLNLRDELFWFGKPKLLLWLIQLISFQNAFEMAAFLWSMWEIRDSSCFMDNEWFAAVRLVFGVLSQFWCSFITFPLYIIITQMDAKFKKTVVSESIRKSVHRWKRRVKARHSSASVRGLSTTTSSISMAYTEKSDKFASGSTQRCTSGVANAPSYQDASCPEANTSASPNNGGHN